MNFLLLFLGTLVQFIFSALWYSPLLFGKKWMSIMGTSHMTKEEVVKSEKKMIPFYVLQFFLTLTTSVFIYLAVSSLSKTGAVVFSLLMWLAFVFPTQISTVIWGNTPKNKWLMQIAILGTCQLLCMIMAALIFGGTMTVLPFYR